MTVLPYTDLVDEQWADVALETITIGAHAGERNPIYLDISGHCPRCSDDMSATHWLVTIAGVSPLHSDEMVAAVEALRAKGIDVGETLPAEFAVKCSCDVTHPDPKQRTGLVGCGATWRMRVEHG
jgi:hypothetical protein